MRVLYRCAEDGTLAMVESKNIYQEDEDGAVCFDVLQAERRCDYMRTDVYEERLKEGAKIGCVDFSDYRFEDRIEDDENNSYPWLGVVDEDADNENDDDLEDSFHCF